MCCGTSQFLCDTLGCVCGLSTGDISKVSLKTPTQKKKKASTLLHLHSMLKKSELKTASLNEKKKCAVNRKEPRAMYTEHTAMQCSGTCKVFRCQQKSHLCPGTLSLLVSTCNMATRLIPPSLSSTPLHSFTLYTPAWRLSPSSNCLDSFINILIRFACIKVATFLVRSKHLVNPLNSRYMLTDSSKEQRQTNLRKYSRYSTT